MRVIETNAYTYDELSDEAKEKAREWYRSATASDDFFSECVFDNAATVADLMGIDLCWTRPGNPANPYKQTIYYSGFYSQGDGACFECTYQYKAGAGKAVAAHAPEDEELQRIAEALQTLQKRYFYKLRGSTKHRGHYYNSRSMDIALWHVDDEYRTIPEHDDFDELMRDFADWIYKELERSYDDQNSDDFVAETIISNEYEFDISGRRI